jgi:hypothetical protein
MAPGTTKPPATFSGSNYRTSSGIGWTFGNKTYPECAHFLTTTQPTECDILYAFRSRQPRLLRNMPVAALPPLTSEPYVHHSRTQQALFRHGRGRIDNEPKNCPEMAFG